MAPLGQLGGNRVRHVMELAGRFSQLLFGGDLLAVDQYIKPALPPYISDRDLELFFAVFWGGEAPLR